VTAKVIQNAEAFRLRIMRNVEVLSCGCWQWTGQTSKSRHGDLYPRIAVRLDMPHPSNLYAHRVSFEAFSEQEIAEGLEVDHKCVNTLCVNPAHLQEVTGQKNKQLARQRRSSAKTVH
jgi:hypothetical protein